MKNRIRALLAATFFSSVLSCHSCHHPSPSHSDAAEDGGDAGSAGTTLEIQNVSGSGVQVYVAFGAQSTVTPKSPGWEFCAQYLTYPMVCDFLLTGLQQLPLKDQYFNATISFGGPVTCGTTKAEFDLNSTAWYDTMDLSLVDGFNASLGIGVQGPNDAGLVTLGPVLFERGNERAFGVYPLACDICVSRQKPSCGYKRGPSPECKKGTQSDPDVVCQYQGAAMHGADTAVKLTYFGMPGKEVLHLGMPDGD